VGVFCKVLIIKGKKFTLKCYMCVCSVYICIYKLTIKKSDTMQMPTYNELIFALEILTIPFIASAIYYLLTPKKSDTNGRN